MNMGLHKIAENRMLKQKCMEVEHAVVQLFIFHSYIYLSDTVEFNVHSYMHSFNMFITFINEKYGCRSKNGQDHLSYEELDLQLATSLQRSTQP